jgi:hypothetical protein
MASQHSGNGPSSSLVAKIGRWTNSQTRWIAKIPGTFTLFRQIHHVVYPDVKADVDYATKLAHALPTEIRKILIVSPQSWDSSRMPWKPAMGNYFYDIWQSARERYGEDKVLLFQIQPGDPTWSSKLLKMIVDSDPSHVLFQGEEDPNGDHNAWPSFGAQLAKVWDGQLIFLMYDSVYWWHIFNAEKVARVYPNTTVHAIDRDPYELNRKIPRSGPGVLPTSLETLKILQSDKIFATRPDSPGDVTCVGSLYPDRIKQLRKFERSGIIVRVNPHREGRSDRPSYTEYAAAIGHSWATINLSRNHGMPRKHVKTRVLEAPLFGTLLLSDEKVLSSQIIPEDAFVYFTSPQDLKQKIRFLQENPATYEEIRARGIQYAQKVTNSIFWEKIEGLNS